MFGNFKFVFAKFPIALLMMFFVSGAENFSHAETITTASYVETNSFFQWTFVWDAVFPSSGQLIISPTNPPGPSTPTLWMPTFDLVSSLPPPGFLAFTAQHTCDGMCPHPGIDDPNGGKFSSGVVDLVDLAPTALNTFVVVHHPGLPPLSNITVDHPTTEGAPHLDLYTVTYNRPVAGGPVTFVFSGVHVVPEPASLVLMGLGLLGVAGLALRVGSRRDGSGRID